MPDGDRARRVCGDQGLLGHGSAHEAIGSERVMAPHLVDVEVASGLRGLAVGARVPEAVASAALEAWRSFGLTRFAVHPLLPRVWELRRNLTAYDATYVALAEELDCPLMIADARIARAAGPRCEVTVLPEEHGVVG
ncbi:type II toxin-antitoxin system VapC family toxin [Georgenia sp. AZ-5]|uniref:type II toxin-antitoxin system VapC family toxin n=1 Tax=Georgenia sp. AZ-5 TaxID=3367526 RepID=UPI003754D5B0